MLQPVTNQGWKRKEVSVANFWSNFDPGWIRIRMCQGKDVFTIIVD